jgi:hypothetical protein
MRGTQEKVIEGVDISKVHYMYVCIICTYNDEIPYYVQFNIHQ